MLKQLLLNICSRDVDLNIDFWWYFKTALGKFAIFEAINKPRPAVINSLLEVLSYEISRQRIKIQEVIEKTNVLFLSEQRQFSQ